MKITPAYVVILIALLTAPVHAQTVDRVTLYADRQRTDCSISETGVQEVSVYMFYEGVSKGAGTEFRAPKPLCWAGATWTGDALNPSVLTIGSSQGDWLAVAFYDLACTNPPIYIGKILFEVTGAAQACCKYPVLPSKAYQTVIMHDCATGYLVPIAGGSAVINEDASCPCSPPVAVNGATWGRVKSLYH